MSQNQRTNHTKGFSFMLLLMWEITSSPLQFAWYKNTWKAVGKFQRNALAVNYFSENFVNFSNSFLCYHFLCGCVMLGNGSFNIFGWNRIFCSILSTTPQDWGSNVRLPFQTITLGVVTLPPEQLYRLKCVRGCLYLLFLLHFIITPERNIRRNAKLNRKSDVTAWILFGFNFNACNKYEAGTNHVMSNASWDTRT